MIKVVVYYTSCCVQQIDATDDVCYCFASFMSLPRYIDIRYAAKAPRWRLLVLYMWLSTILSKAGYISPL